MQHAISPLQTDTPDVFTIAGKLVSTPDAVTQALHEVHDALGKCSDRCAPTGMWEIALAETLNNIVEHAYCDTPTGEIEMQLCFGQGQMTAEFTDHGYPMPGGTAPSGEAANVNVPLEDMPEGGFGWFLIRSLTSRLEYSRRGNSNHLFLEIPYDPDPAATADPASWSKI